MNVIGYLIKQWRFYTKGDRCMMNTVLYCNNLHSLTTTTTTTTSAFSSSLQHGTHIFILTLFVEYIKCIYNTMYYTILSYACLLYIINI